MKCVQCGRELGITNDDFINGICGNCRFKEYTEPLQGWICPRCGQVHSPFSLVCGCSPPTISSNTIELIETNNLKDEKQ